MPDQTPPADELAAVREQIKALQSREAELRTLMFRDPSARTGNNYVAEIRESYKDQIDVKELRAEWPAVVAQYTFKMKVESVVLKGIDDDGVIIPLLRKRRRENAA